MGLLFKVSGEADFRIARVLPIGGRFQYKGVSCTLVTINGTGVRTELPGLMKADNQWTPGCLHQELSKYTIYSTSAKFRNHAVAGPPGTPANLERKSGG